MLISFLGDEVFDNGNIQTQETTWFEKFSEVFGNHEGISNLKWLFLLNIKAK